MHGSVWGLVSEGNGKSFRFRCHVLPVTLLLVFSLHSFLPSSFVASAQCVHLLFVLTTISSFLSSSLSLVFSRSFSQSQAPLFTRSRQISCSDFSVKITLFQLLTLTQSHPLFCTRFASFYERDKNALAPTLPCRRTCEKNLFSGYLDGHFCFFFFVVTNSFRQQNQYTNTPSMTMMTMMTVWQVC